MDKLEKLNKDPEFYQYMSHEEDERKIYNSRMYEAEQKGLEKGLQKGIEKGLQKGIEEGKNTEKIAITKKMLEKNMSIEEIMKITSLSQQEIEKLKSTN